MPLVGTAKRREGFPIDVPEREAEVLEAAVAQLRNAARESGRDASSGALTSAIGEFFRAQFDAAKQIQLAALRDELIPDDVPLPDVEEALRPALDRIGERIARLVVALPEDLELDAIRRAALQELRSELLPAPARERLCQAVLALVLNQRASARAASPASSGTQTQTP
jgi:chorismate mutase